MQKHNTHTHPFGYFNLIIIVSACSERSAYTIINYCITLPRFEMLSLSISLYFLSFFFFLLCHVLLANLCCVLPVCVLCNSSKTKIGFLFVCFLFNQNPIPSHRGNFFFSKKGEFVKLFVLFSLLCFCNLPPINHHQQRKQNCRR
jgi:hypothetical protein